MTTMAPVHRTGVQHPRIAKNNGEPEREQHGDGAGEVAHWST